MKSLSNLLKASSLLLIGAVVAGCQSKAGTGTLVGAGAGAAVGGLIGSMSHSRAGAGMAIGAGVGALGGYLVGNEMDKADQRERDAYNRDSRSYQPARNYSVESQPITKDDVINWTGRGMREEIIIDRIERSGTVFHLTAADENQLRDRGVSEAVIRAMRDTARR